MCVCVCCVFVFCLTFYWLLGAHLTSIHNFEYTSGNDVTPCKNRRCFVLFFVVAITTLEFWLNQVYY